MTMKRPEIVRDNHKFYTEYGLNGCCHAGVEREKICP
jgi:hypothetical protein